MAKINKNINKILAVGLVSLFFAVFLAANSSIAQAAEIKVSDVVKLLNQARVANGLDVLKENSILDQAAEAKAQDMVKNDYFAHTSPAGVDPWYWFKKAGYNYKYAGENLAINYDSAEEQHKAWMNSQTHRANILNANYYEVGVAVIKGNIDGENSLLTVELFGAPLFATTGAAQKEIQALPQTQKVAGQEAVPVESPKTPAVVFPVPQNANNIEVINFIWLAALITFLFSLAAGPMIVLLKSWKIIVNRKILFKNHLPIVGMVETPI